MEYEISFDSDVEIAVVKTSGVASLGGFVAYLRALVADPRWRRGMDLLSDHTALEAGNLTAGDMEVLVGLYFPFAHAIGPGLCAIVCGSSLELGLARMFDAQASGRLPFNSRVFTNLEEALDWLRAGDTRDEPASTMLQE
jgi:hypothetical protein